MAEYRSEHRNNLDGILSVSVFNPVGRIMVTGWDEPDLLIEFTVTVSDGSGSSDTYQPRITRSDDHLTIRPPEIVMTDFDEKGAFTFEFDSDRSTDDFSTGMSEFVESITQFAKSAINSKSPGLNTSMNIHLPRSMPLKIRNFNGVISVSEMTSQVRAKGLNGPISLSRLSGQVIAQTINGPVSIENSACPDLTLKSVNGPVKCYLDTVSGSVCLKTVNGPIRMMVPRTSDVNLTAGTLHGTMKISSDFVSSQRSSRKIHSSLNAGKHDVTIKTTTGAITVITSEDGAPESAGRPPAEDRASRPSAHRPVDTANPLPVNPQSDPSPDSLIDRMLNSGKITPEEAERLRSAI